MIHQAGAMDDAGVQRCTRCGAILVDYRTTRSAGSTLSGWNVGTFLEVKALEQSQAGYTRQTQDPPDCPETVQEQAPPEAPVP